MKIYFHLNVESFSNTYIIANSTTKKAVIIDPAKITNTMIQHLERGKYMLEAVLITHNNTWHANGVQTLLKIYNPAIYSGDYEVAGVQTTVLKGDGIIKIAGFSISYTSLPSHTVDSLIYKIGRAIFTGDALLAGQLGNTNSSYAKKMLIANVRNKILSQPDDLALMPGHGPPSTICAEKRFNLDFGCPVLHKVKNLPDKMFLPQNAI